MGQYFLKPIYLLFTIIIALFLTCSNNNIAGSGSESGNPIVVGKIVNADGEPAKEAIVFLSSGDYNPVLDGVIANSSIDTTNSSGEYFFDIPDTGVFNIEAGNKTRGLKLLIMEIPANTDTTVVPTDTLKEVGHLKIAIHDTMDIDNGYLYFKGTKLYNDLSNTIVLNDSIRYLIFDSIPADTLINLFYDVRNDSYDPVRLIDAIVINPGDTTSLDFVNEVYFIEHTISTTVDAPISVFAADINSDGNMDILSASTNDDKVNWYENTGDKNFVSHTITTDADFPKSVYAIDLDKDGDTDVLSASSIDNKIAWYENNGNGNFTTHIISTNDSGATCVYAADMDNDGDVDVISTSSWYENDGNENFTGTGIVLDSMLTSVYAEDIDGDGDLDILRTFLNDNRIDWLRNDANGEFYYSVGISTNAQNVNDAYATDIDNDGDMDVLSASWGDEKIAWYENDGAGNFIEYPISTSYETYDVYAADLDGDGDDDVIAPNSADDKIHWYENDGSGVFTEKVVYGSVAGVYAIHAEDVDKDGDIDIIAACRESNKITWYENKRIY